MAKPEGAPRGLDTFEPEQNLDIEPTGDNLVLQKVSITHGKIELVDAAGTKKGKDTEMPDSYFFGYVLAAGPGRYTAEGKLLPMVVKAGDFIKLVGRAFPHHTPSHKKVWIASADTVVAIFKPEKAPS